MPFSNQKQCRVATIKKVCPALGQNKAVVSTLNRFNKTYNEADSSKHKYWPVQIAITSQKSSKASFLPKYIA